MAIQFHLGSQLAGSKFAFERLVLDVSSSEFVGTKHLGPIESELLLGHATGSVANNLTAF